MTPLLGVQTRRFSLLIDGTVYDEWTEGEIVRDLKDFSGSFSFTLREASRSLAGLEWASLPPSFRIKKGSAVIVQIDGEKVLDGHIETIEREIDEERAEVTVGGRDKSGDLVDCTAVPDGPSEFKGLKLEDVLERIAKPFNLTVRSEIDTGKPFERYAVDLTETGLSAIEKGARQRHALVLSDGVGGLVITRSGGTRAPADLTQPGNIKRSRVSESDEKRHSQTIVRGQGERGGGRRKGRAAALDATAEPLDPGSRAEGDGAATERERAGTAMTGRSDDPEMQRYRPKVHLTKSQPDETSVQDEADWRMRTARAGSEDVIITVHDFRVSGALWKVNQLSFVSDAYQDIERDLLISRTSMTYGEDGALTELTLTSPEAFDKKPVKGRRNNLPARAGTKAKAGKKAAGPLDGTAEGL